MDADNVDTVYDNAHLSAVGEIFKAQKEKECQLLELTGRLLAMNGQERADAEASSDFEEPAHLADTVLEIGERRTAAFGAAAASCRRALQQLDTWQQDEAADAAALGAAAEARDGRLVELTLARRAEAAEFELLLAELLQVWMMHGLQLLHSVRRAPCFDCKQL